MDFSALIADLRTIASRYNGKDTDRDVSTAMYCEMFRKILQKAENGVSEYSDQIVILWMTLSQLCNTYQTLTPCPARDSLYEHIFLLCAKVVLNIKWQQLPEDDQGKVNFSQTIANTHQHLVNTGFKRFELLPHLMENPWTDPTLSKIMSGDDKEESSGSDTETEETEREKDRKIKEKMDEISNYIKKEDTLILKLRVEMLILENCEDFASNLCNCLVRYSPFKEDLDVREMQFKLLHKQNQMDKLQEECEQIVCHSGIKLINRLEQKESNQQLCVRLVQIFLVQDWINPDRTCCTKDLIKLWIRHQYMADRDRTKFLENVWSIAKISSKTEQIGVLVTGLQKECGTKLRQLYTDLCVYAINLDKGSCEKLMMNGDMEGVKEKQKSMSMTCEKLAGIVAMNNLKAAKISALTAFALNPTRSTMGLVEKMYLNKTLNQASERKKERNERKNKDLRHTHDGEVNLATLYEVERLLNMLRPYYLNPDLTWHELQPVCQKFMLEKGTNDWKEMQKHHKEKMQQQQEEKVSKVVKEVKSPPLKDISVEKKSSTVKEGSLQYYCDDTTQFSPYQVGISAKIPDGLIPSKSPWTLVQSGTQNKPSVKESKLIPWTKMQSMSIQNNPLDMTKASSSEQIKQKANIEASKKPKERPSPMSTNFDLAKLLEATKNMPQIQTFMKPSASVSIPKVPTTQPSGHGNVHLPFVPGLTSHEVQQAMLQQKKNLSRSFSVDQLQSEKKTASKVLQNQQRERTLSVDRQQSNQLSQLSGWTSKSASDLTKTPHQPRIIPHKTQPQVKSSQLAPFQQSFGGNVKQQPSHTQQQVNSAQNKNFSAPVVTQTLPARRSRQPSKEELQSIVDWLQTGTEDAKIKPSNVSQILLSNETNTTSVSKSKKPSTVQSGNQTQYVAIGSSPSQALQNTKKNQEQLKIKGNDKSKNFASHVMSKVGIRPGMTQEEINIARIKEIMRQQQEEVKREKHLKKLEKSPSKGFLLIPGSAQTVMQAKMQGDRTKILQDKMKGVQKPSKMKPSSSESKGGSQANLQSTVSIGQNYVNQMLQSANPQSAQTGVSQMATVASSSSKAAKFNEFDIQYALQSLSKVLDKSSNVLSKNPALLGKSKNEEIVQRPVRPASAMPNLMTSQTTVTTATNTMPVPNSASIGGNSSLQKQPSPQLPVDASSYQLLYLGQIKTTKSPETSQQQVSSSQTLQSKNIAPRPVQNLQVNSSNVLNVVNQPANLTIQQDVASTGTQNILSPMTGHVSLQEVSASALSPPSATLQTINPQGLIVGTQLAQTGSVQRNVIQTLTPPSMTLCSIAPSSLPIQAQAVQNINLQGIPSDYQPLPINSFVQGQNNLNLSQNMLGQCTLIQGQNSFVPAQNLLLQGQNTLIQGQSNIVHGQQTFLHGQNAVVQGQGVNIGINTASLSPVQTGQTFGIQGVTNQNNALPVIQGMNFQTPLDTGQPTFVQPQQFGLNPGTQILGVNTLPNGTTNLTIERMQPNTTVTFTNPTVVMSTEISASTTALTLNNQNVIQNVNNAIIPQNTVPMAANAISFDSNNAVLGSAVAPPFSFVEPAQSSQQPGNLLVQNTSNISNQNFNLANHVTVVQPISAQPMNVSLSSPKVSKSSGQPVAILPKTPVFVGPFKLLADSTRTTTVTGAQGCLIPTSSPPKVMQVSSASASPKISQSCDLNNTLQPSPVDKLSLKHLKELKLSNSEQERTRPSELSNDGMEIVRRVELSELEKENLEESDRLVQETLTPAKSDECQTSLSSYPISSDSKVFNSVDSGLQSIDKPAIDTLLNSVIPPMSSAENVSIVDVHITTFSQSNETTTESRKDETLTASTVQETITSDSNSLSKSGSEKHSNFLSDAIQENFWKDFNRFKERLATAKVTSNESQSTRTNESIHIGQEMDVSSDNDKMNQSKSDNINEECSPVTNDIIPQNSNQDQDTYRELVEKKINDLLHHTNSEYANKDQSTSELTLPLQPDTEKVEKLPLESQESPHSFQTMNTLNEVSPTFVASSEQQSYNKQMEKNLSLSPSRDNRKDLISDRPNPVSFALESENNEESQAKLKVIANDREIENNVHNINDNEVIVESCDKPIESANQTVIDTVERYNDATETSVHEFMSSNSGLPLQSKSEELVVTSDEMLDSNKDISASATSIDKENEVCLIQKTQSDVEQSNIDIARRVKHTKTVDTLDELQTTVSVPADILSDKLSQSEQCTNSKAEESKSDKTLEKDVNMVKNKLVTGLVDYSETSDSDALTESNINNSRRTVGIVDYPESSDSESETYKLQSAVEALTPSTTEDNLCQIDEADSIADGLSQNVQISGLPSSILSDCSSGESKTIIEDSCQEDKIPQEYGENLSEKANSTSHDVPTSTFEKTGHDGSDISEPVIVDYGYKNIDSENSHSDDENNTTCDNLTVSEIDNQQAPLTHEVYKEVENKLTSPDKQDSISMAVGNLTSKDNVLTEESVGELKDDPVVLTLHSNQLDNNSGVKRDTDHCAEPAVIPSGDVVDEVPLSTGIAINDSMDVSSVDDDRLIRKDRKALEQNASVSYIGTEDKTSSKDASESKLSTPQKNDLVANYKMLMEEMLSLSATKKGTEAHAGVDDRFTVRKSFGFDDVEKSVAGRQNGIRESSVPGFSIFADDLNRLPESCNVNKLQTRSLPDDWAPGQHKGLERSLSNEERKLRRSSSDIDVANMDNSSNDFDTHSVISDREYQEKSLNSMQKGFQGALEFHQLQYGGKGSKYRKTLPALKIKARKPQSETHLLTYGEWKNKDNKVEIVSNRKSPIIMNSDQKEQPEEPKVIHPTKVKEKEGPPKCKICLRTFDTIKALQQHVIHPCRPDIRKTVMQFKELDYRTVYTCNSCKVSCETEFAARLHCDNCTGITGKRSHGYSINTFFRCKMCGETMNYQVTALEHVKEKCLALRQRSEKETTERSKSSNEETINENGSKKTQNQNERKDVEKSIKVLEVSVEDKVERKNNSKEVKIKENESESTDDKNEMKDFVKDEKYEVSVEDKFENMLHEEVPETNKVNAKLDGNSCSKEGNETYENEREKDIDNVSIKSFSTEASTATVDTSETSSIKSGESKPRVVKQKQSARLISENFKKMGKRVIKAKQYFGEFEVSEFVEKQAKKMNLKRKFKSVKSLSPKMRKSLKSKKLVDVRRKLKTNPKWHNDGKNLQVSSLERTHMLSRRRAIIERVKSLPLVNVTKKNNTDFLNSISFKKEGRDVYRCPVKICRGPFGTQKSLMEHFDIRHKVKLYKRAGSKLHCLYCTFSSNSSDKILDHSATHLINVVVDLPSEVSPIILTNIISLLEKEEEKPIQDFGIKVRGCEMETNKNNVKFESTTPLGNTILDKNSKLNVDENSTVRRSARKKMDGLSAYKDFELHGMKVTNSGTDEKSKMDQNVDEKVQDDLSSSTLMRTRRVRVNNVDIGLKLEDGQNKGKKNSSSRESMYHNKVKKEKVEVKEENINEKNEDEKPSIKSRRGKLNHVDSHDLSKEGTLVSDNTTCRRSRRKRHQSGESTASKASTFEDSKSDISDLDGNNRHLRMRHISHESNSGKASKESKTESEIQHNHRTKKREHSFESSSDKGETQNKKVKPDNSSESNDKNEVSADRQTKVLSKRRRGSDLKLLEDNKDLLDMQSRRQSSTAHSKEDELDRFSDISTNSSKHSKDGKFNRSKEDKHRRGPDYILLQENKDLLDLKPRNRTSSSTIGKNNCKSTTTIVGKNVKENDESRKAGNNNFVTSNNGKKNTEKKEATRNKESKEKLGENKQKSADGGKESHNPFLESFKKFVGISKKTYSSPIRSLKQGKSSKLKSQAILNQRKQHLRKSKELKEERETKNAAKLASQMVNVMDVVEIKDFRKNSAGNKKVEIIDLTSETDLNSVKKKTIVNSTEPPTSNSMNSSFLDSFLAHVNKSHRLQAKNEDSSSKLRSRKVGVKTQGSSLMEKCREQQHVVDTTHGKKIETSKNNVKRSHKNNSKALLNKPEEKSAEETSLDGVKGKDTSNPKKTPISSKKGDAKETQEKMEIANENKLDKTVEYEKKSLKNKSHSKNKTSDSNDVLGGKAQVDIITCNEEKLVEEKSAVAANDKELKNLMEVNQKTNIAVVNKGTGKTKSKGSDTAFQNCFMSYLGSDDCGGDLNVESQEFNNKNLLGHKSPFKWDLDEDDGEAKCKNVLPHKKDSSRKSDHDLDDLNEDNSDLKSHNNCERADSQTDAEILKNAAAAFTNCLSLGENSLEKTANSGHHVDFEKHFKEFISKSAGDNNVDLAESPLVNNSIKPCIEQEKKNAKVGPSNSGARKEFASETGEKKTKSVSSTLDNTQCRTKPSCKGLSSGNSEKNRIAKYNLPYSQSKRISSKCFVVKKTMESKKLIPISELNVINTQDCSGKNKPLLQDCTVKDMTNFDNKTSTTSSHHKLQSRDQHRVRHMYHGGKVWQIGQGSVSSTSLSGPSKNVSSTPCSDLLNDGGNETGNSKESEKQSRWKARKSPSSRLLPAENELPEKKAKTS